MILILSTKPLNIENCLSQFKEKSFFLNHLELYNGHNSFLWTLLTILNPIEIQECETKYVCTVTHLYSLL